MMTKYLIAVDPGLMTGVMEFKITDEGTTMSASHELGFNDFMDYLVALDNIAQGMEDPKDLTVVCEDFIVTMETAKKMTAQMWSLHLIGALKYLSHKHGFGLAMQKPAQRMSISHDQLKGIGWWHVGGAGHANQAARHAVVYMLDVLKDKTLARRILSL